MQSKEVVDIPVYDFECLNGTITEKFVEMGTKAIICRKCHNKAGEIIFICTSRLKGGGWYSDCYSSKKIERRK